MHQTQESIEGTEHELEILETLCTSKGRTKQASQRESFARMNEIEVVGRNNPELIMFACILQCLKAVRMFCQRWLDEDYSRWTGLSTRLSSWTSSISISPRRSAVGCFVPVKSSTTYSNSSAGS